MKQLLNLCSMIWLGASIYAGSAHASLLVSIPTVTVNAGSFNNFFDVTLTNTGPVAVLIGGFGVGVSVTDSSINLIDATTDTGNLYIFFDGSLLGPDILGATTGLSLTAGDVSLLGDLIAPGQTVGLAHVLFNVGPSAAGGNFVITLDPIATSFADPTATNIPIDSFVDGAITVADVPEPPSYVGVLAGLMLLSVSYVLKTRVRIGQER